MTNSNGSRLDRIEAIVESLARTVQALADDHEERIQTMQDTIVRIEETNRRLVTVEEGLARMLSSLDDDRPTILRRLNSIENKVDRLLDRE